MEERLENPSANRRLIKRGEAEESVGAQRSVTKAVCKAGTKGGGLQRVETTLGLSPSNPLWFQA